MSSSPLQNLPKTFTAIISGFAILKEYADHTEQDINPMIRNENEILSSYYCCIFFGILKTKNVGTGAKVSENEAIYNYLKSLILLHQL